MSAARPPAARLITVGGRVQGVGFRPFVHRLAHRLGVKGWVLNASGEVRIDAEAQPGVLDVFARQLVDDAPPLARPVIKRQEAVAAEDFADFRIRSSLAGEAVDIHVPPDQFACDDCLAEMSDPHEHRHRYPFINCTQCGPRYTIIRTMPYDRPNTSMRDFPLCPTCRREYADPLDRRFHAQPLACPDCGPALRYHGKESASEGNALSMAQCLMDLGQGKIIAVKGIGGYHLICDATNDEAVARLRQRKVRPSKPLAVMVPWTGEDGLDEARRFTAPSTIQSRALIDPMRPIVLVPCRPGSGLSTAIAPGLDEVGLMLPYSPMHHLLLDAFGGPLVATSGNISGEPVITDPDEAERRLSGVADCFMHHNRPIERPADDPVIREIAGVARPVRLGRGNAPLELELAGTLDRPVLAAGAFLKNTVALAWGNRVVISPHIGDLSSLRGREIFNRVAADLQRLYGITAEAIVCDAHPDYPNSRWARRSGLPVIEVFHHHAHASALAGEFSIERPMLVFTWDGVGLGEDATAWGGEALVGSPGSWRRRASFRAFALPGGDRAVLQPWRTALSLAWECNAAWHGAPPFPPLLRSAWESRLNSPLSSAVGRLFDAAASFAGLVTDTTWEGEAPMRLEAAIDPGARDAIVLPLCRDDEGIWRADWAPLVKYLAESGATPGELAGVFHESMAQTLLQQAITLRDVHSVQDVGFAGGVFQNRHLTERARQLLAGAGFTVHIPGLLPVNDAGISYGQVIEAAATIAGGTRK